MIINNVEFHNIDSIVEKPYGIQLVRYSKDLLSTINPNARYMARWACNSEIRFVTESNTSFVSLMSETNSTRVSVFCGDYFVSEHILHEGVVTQIMLSVPDTLKSVDKAFFENNVFSKNVWRLHLHGMVSFCGIDTLDFSHRPPKPEELPEKTMLSYGSSISHGAGTIYNPLSYVNTLAKLLKVDCLAKGVGGSCFAEPEIADSFAKRDDWDFALLELGTNMTNDFSAEEFEKRFVYFADTMYKTGKKLIFTTIFINSNFYKDNEAHRKIMEFSEIIRKKCSEFDKKRVMLAEGTDVLCDTAMLTADGIHPSTEGHVKMGNNLYEIVKNFIK